ncbi:site-2 protease family protein [Candidatus Bathyarchaeota archaeon]|nr:site-2 protease family protein [Candidatus Bathyarchaeota archaeon]
MGAENETTRFFRILEIIKTEFIPRQSYVREGVPTFVVPFDTQTMDKINRLTLRLSSENLSLILGQGGSEVTLQIVPRQIAAHPSFRFIGLNLSFILFIATIVTVTISGYYISSDYVGVLSMLHLISPSNVSFAIWSQTALYAVTIMSVVGLHEVGHFIAAKRHGVKASLPLFIPGIPGLFPGTFGAFIRQERPASNRNQLFDIGIAGPAVGFVIAMVASVVGYSMSIGLTSQEYIAVFGLGGGAGVIYPPLIFLLTGRWIFPNPSAYTHVLHPLALAGWAGTLITFLNAFPIGQLDGGHVSRALLGRTWHRRLGFAMIALMFLSGWWTMALLVMFLIRTDHPGTMDDVTYLTPKRKLLGLAFVVMFIAVFTLSPDSPLLMLLFG